MRHCVNFRDNKGQANAAIFGIWWEFCNSSAECCTLKN